MMLEVHGLVEVDHVVDQRRELRRQRAGLTSDTLHLLAAGGALDAASSRPQPSLHALQVTRSRAEAPSELPRADPAMILGGGRVLLRGEERAQRGLVPAAEPDVGSSSACRLREMQ